MIEVKNVTMGFRMANDRIVSLKEFIVKKLKGELQYKEFLALQDVSFTVERGEVLGIIGSNGAGKSTLLKVISGILTPGKGSVKVSGSISPLLELGAGFDIDLTARENVFLNGAVLGYSKQYLTERYQDIVEFSELQEFMNTPIRNFSSGMTMRLAFSIATIVEPDILIVDEILAVGDARFQRKSLQRMKQLMGGGATVLLVSHSLQQVRELCTRVLWLDHGKLMQVGDPDDVCDEYLRFMGETPPLRTRENLSWRHRLYTPTCIERYGGRTFIVDCWHHRILYSDDPAAPIGSWRTMTDVLYTPQSLASDGDIFLSEDVRRHEVHVFRATKKSGYAHVQTVSGVGLQPHRILYDGKGRKFYGIAAQSGEVFVLENRGGRVERTALVRIPALQNCYTRSLSLIGGQLYLVSGPGKILALDAESLKVKKQYEVPFELRGMNDLFYMDGYYYLSVYQDGSMEIHPRLVRVKRLEELAEGRYEDLYGKLKLRGVPYYFSIMEGRICLTEIDSYSRILSFRTENGRIIDRQVLFDFGAANASSRQRRESGGQEER